MALAGGAPSPTSGLGLGYSRDSLVFKTVELVIDGGSLSLVVCSVLLDSNRTAVIRGCAHTTCMLVLEHTTFFGRLVRTSLYAELLGCLNHV